ncbi:MAG: transporter substrate-binding domain-containing protein [Acetobacteraceae bacterium]
MRTAEMGWRRIRVVPAALLLGTVLLCGIVPAIAQAEEVRPCEPDKLATRYPGLVGKTIRIGQDGASVPYTYRDPKDPDHIIGSDADYARSVFGCIGMPVEFVIGTWGGLIAAVSSGRIDVMWDVLYYTPERAKIVDFVLYEAASDAAVVRHGNPKNINSLDDLCGKRGLGGLGTIEANLLQVLSKKCTDAGKDAIDIYTYSDKPSAWRMIENDRGDVVLGSAAMADALVAERPEVFGIGFRFLPDIKCGVGVAKGNTELEQAIRDGIEATQASGQIAKIFATYKLDPALIIAPAILTK